VSGENVDAQVRYATSSDLPGLLALYRELVSDDPELTPDQALPIWEDLSSSSPMARIVVADRDGTVAATCMIVIVPNLTRGGRSFALIENVVTLATMRRQGLATAVLRFAQDAAWQAGCYKIMLSSGSRVEATLRFYENAGFIRGSKTFFEARRI
jgi:GNAT superfamily N-acetyltransferase